MGHINLVSECKFWKIEEIDKVEQFVEIKLEEVLKNFIEYHEIPYSESIIMFKQMISNTLSC